MFSNGLQKALAEGDDASFQRPMTTGGPPQWSGASDPVPANASVNASVNDDLGIATSEAAAYLALGKTAPGAQVSVARGRYKVMAQPHMKAGKLFVTMSDLGSPTGDRYTLVVPSDANILPKLVKQGSVKGQVQVVNTATLRSEDIDEMTIDGVPYLQYEGKTKGEKMPADVLARFKKKTKKKGEDEEDDEEMDEEVQLDEFAGKGLGSMAASGKAAMLQMLRDKKAKEDEKKKGKGKSKDEDVERDDDRLDEFAGKGLGSTAASGKAAMLQMLRAKKAKEDEKKKGKGKDKGSKDKDTY